MDICCFARPTIAYNSCGMSDCILPTQLKWTNRIVRSQFSSLRSIEGARWRRGKVDKFFKSEYCQPFHFYWWPKKETQKWVISFCRILRNEKCRSKDLSRRFHLNSNNIGFRPKNSFCFCLKNLF